MALEPFHLLPAICFSAHFVLYTECALMVLMHTLQVATLQMRLERMGRMEASISAARRSNDDSASADRSRKMSLAIALGACGCGGLAAWLLMSRLQQSKS